jgi:hypothetical protein
MAGLLDIFGTGGTQSMGLLGMSPEDIKRARDDAQAQALYSLAGRLFQGGNTGQSIAQGLQMGQQAYKQALQGQLQDRLQTSQLQDALQKRQEAEAAKLRQAQVQKLLGQAVRPGMAAVPAQMVEEDGRYMGETPAMAARPASFDIQSIAPQLMATPEGRTELSNLLKTQEMMQPKMTTLKPEEQLGYMRDGQFVTVAQGAPKTFAPELIKVPKLTGKEGNAALMLFGTDDVNKLREIPGAVDKIRNEATIQRKAEQPQINLSDPTAVQTQQLKTINQWEGLLKDGGDAVTASRAGAFYNALDLARKGNVNADGALIYNLAKVYDPSGAVQQGDVDTIIGNRSIPTQVQLLAQKIKAGGTFTPKERNNMKAIIDGMVAERKKAIEPSLNTYRKINKNLGGDDAAIYNPYEQIKPPKSLEEILGFGRPRGGN